MKTEMSLSILGPNLVHKMLKLFQTVLFHSLICLTEFLNLLRVEIIHNTWLNRRKRAKTKNTKKLKLKLSKKLLSKLLRFNKKNQRLCKKKLLPKKPLSKLKLKLKLKKNKKIQLIKKPPQRTKTREKETTKEVIEEVVIEVEVNIDQEETTKTETMVKTKMVSKL